MKRLQLLIFCIILIFRSGYCQWSKFDYQPKTATTQPYQIINSIEGNGPSTLPEGAMFGWSLANIGDLNSDGSDDLLVGAIGEPCSNNGTVQVRCGAIYVLFMSANGSTVENYVRITNEINGGPIYLQPNDNFGYAVSRAGDIDGDGVTDLAAGAPGTYTGGSLYLLLMNADGTVREHVLIRGQANGGGPPVKYMGRFASTIAFLGKTLILATSPALIINIGDINKDGRDELAVGMADFAAGESRVFLMSFNANGTVYNYTRLQLKNPQGVLYYPPINADFGYSVSTVGDINGDGVVDIAIGAPRYTDPMSTVQGAGGVFLCIMNDTLEVFDYHILTDISPTSSPGYDVVVSGTLNALLAI
jgi:hypothetical protein